jgi:GTP pyrophosphokinase
VETLEVYAPIAHRLGMGRIRGELEDLAFQYAEPEAAAELARQIQQRRLANDQSLEQMRQNITQKLTREGIPARVDSRVKRIYSIYQKLRRQKIGLDQVYDILGIRIITDSVRNCYAALGIIHNEWHRIAEEGIAAHWKYKEGKQGPAHDDQRIAWLRQLVEWQREMRDPSEFMSTFKSDLYREEVYCFTPRGRVIVLPREATPIDFAYAVHSDIGHTCIGAKVNGRIVPLRTQLRNGDVVEILTQAGHMPSKDWLSLVKTSRARNKIRQVVKATERERAIEIGIKSLEREARRLGIALSRIPREAWDRVAAEHGLSKLEDIHAALGFGRFSARQILQPFLPEAPPPRRSLRYRRSRSPGQRHRRGARLSRQMLQPHPRRTHRRLHHPRQGRRRPLHRLRQRHQPHVRSRAPHRCRVDQGYRKALPRPSHDLFRRSRRHAPPDH